ncbi:threonine synthase [Euzebya rosea]|uniref:threonine synthase n=1 Tax=Euzebya rosea TaxID=2052804 RepID=UPI000DF277EA|nr:threonine synthase [Euzebya rosea]
MESSLSFLEGSRSGARYDADVLQRVDPVDGAPLLARYDLERAARTLTPRSLAERHGPGMWRWRELLPVRDARHRVHLGEGSTPLLKATRLGPALGVDNLLVKAEGQQPTGSFKARGMTAAVSRARELGARSLIAPSAGNAGGALAAYGAAAGLPVTVVMPADVPESNLVEAQMCGAQVVLVEGFITDCGRVARAIAERTGAFDVSTMKEPYRVEGKKTMGLELVEQLGWTMPDVIVYPTGGGTGLIGMWKAFDELEALGLAGAGRPRMVSVQAQGCAPIVRAFAAGAETAEPWVDPSTRASGLRVPSAIGDRLILSALRESEGTAVAVPEQEIDAVQRLAGRRGVGYVSPETAAALAAVASLADEGWLSANERVVVFDTGIGHKYPPPELPRPVTLRPEDADDPDLLELVRRGRAGRATAPTRSATPSSRDDGPRGEPSEPAGPAPRLEPDEPDDAVEPDGDEPVALDEAPSPPTSRETGRARIAELMAQRIVTRDPDEIDSDDEADPDEIDSDDAGDPDDAESDDADGEPVEGAVDPDEVSDEPVEDPAAAGGGDTVVVDDAELSAARAVAPAPVHIARRDIGGPRVPGEAQVLRSPEPQPRVPGTAGAGSVPDVRPAAVAPPADPVAAQPPAPVQPSAGPPAATPVQPVSPAPPPHEGPGPEQPTVAPPLPEPAMPTPSAIPSTGASTPEAAGAPDAGPPAGRAPDTKDPFAADDAPAEATTDEPSLRLPRPPFREIVVHPLPTPPRDA